MLKVKDFCYKNTTKKAHEDSLKKINGRWINKSESRVIENFIIIIRSQPIIIIIIIIINGNWISQLRGYFFLSIIYFIVIIKFIF